MVTFVGLSLVLLVVFAMPFIYKRVEHNLEIFLLLMGALSVTFAGLWSKPLLFEAISAPLSLKHPIVEVVFIGGLLFRFMSKAIGHNVNKLVSILGLKLFIFLLIALLGIFSSVITAIISSLVLAQVITILKMDKKTEASLVIVACFSIGMGAALTPVGEPLSTIAIAKLQNSRYNADFFFLLGNLWWLIIPGIIVLGLAGVLLCTHPERGVRGLSEDKLENIYDIVIRTVKVYFFIVALVFLGKGFESMINVFLIKMNPAVLYWINIVSAVLDNATLAAAEISPNMSIEQIRAVLMGLIISGGMLIPGNIPNIICANKLNITSREWARIGVPLGFALMVIYFVIIFILI